MVQDMSAREILEGRMEAQKVCALIMATSRTPAEAERRMRHLLFRLLLHLECN